MIESGLPDVTVVTHYGILAPGGTGVPECASFYSGGAVPASHNEYVA